MALKDVKKRLLYSPLCGTTLVAISASSPINGKGVWLLWGVSIQVKQHEWEWERDCCYQVSKCAELWRCHAHFLMDCELVFRVCKCAEWWRHHAHFLTDCELVFAVDRRLCRGHLHLPFGLVRFRSFLVLHLIVNVFYLSM